MSGVYGDQLAAFPELLQWYDVFTMETLVSGGFGERVLYKRVRAYLTESLGGDAGFPDETFTGFTRAQFFVFSPVPKTVIDQGAYVEDSATGILYKFTQDNTFAREGGFTVHRLLSVEGPSDVHVTMPQVTDRLINDY